MALVDYSGLEKAIGYRFKNTALLAQSLRHASVAGTSNQRMEFLGDALLSWVVAKWLYQMFPDAQEGRLTRMRARVVRQAHLVNMAKALSLEHYIVYDRQAFSAASLPGRMLADALESLFAAIYLDDKLQAEAVVLTLIKRHSPREWLLGLDKDAKTALQEYAQQKRWALPKYVVSEVMQEGRLFYKVLLRVDGYVAEGFAPVKREAEQQAAGQVLLQLEGAGDGG